MQIVNNNGSASNFSFELQAECELYSRVKIAGDWQVDKAGPADISIGTVFVLPAYFPGMANIRTRYSNILKVNCVGAVTAGAPLKLGALDGDGNQTYVVFVPGTDDPTLMVGIAVTGGTDTEIEIMVD